MRPVRFVRAYAFFGEFVQEGAGVTAHTRRFEAAEKV